MIPIFQISKLKFTCVVNPKGKGPGGKDPAALCSSSARQRDILQIPAQVRGRRAHSGQGKQHRERQLHHTLCGMNVTCKQFDYKKKF